MVELLAPAGSYESLVAAVNAGADAVYMGASRFGARAYADNPDTDRFIDGLHYAHRYGAKVYMTVNTLFKEAELAELRDFLLPYYQEGVDAVLVQDLGALSIMRESFPDLPLHASTQMTVTDARSAELARQLGVCRVVPARELSLDEIRDIHDRVDVEIETFVYGAMCYCYSGQCLMSSLIGGRSGNRGRCAQSCRLPYSCGFGGRTEQGRLLSMKDLNALAILPELVSAGICSFKIEGRMKSPRYTAGVTSVWRKYIDRYMEMYGESAASTNEIDTNESYTDKTDGNQPNEYKLTEISSKLDKTSSKNNDERVCRDDWQIDPADLRMLSELFDRGGTTDGYYHRDNGREMMAWDEKKDPGAKESLYAYLDGKYVNVTRTAGISGKAIFHIGEPSSLTAEYRGRQVTVTGDIPAQATGKPMTSDDLRRQLEKTGGTPYRWNGLDIEADDGIFVPVSRLNDLRRRALEALEREVQDGYKRTV